MAHGHPTSIGSVKPVNWAYQRAPMIVYWELTNACGLACRHCRATAMPDPAPGELSTAESIALLDDITGFGDPLPHVVMTGGDPLMRPDLRELIAAARQRGIGVSLAPAVTPLLTAERMREFAIWTFLPLPCATRSFPCHGAEPIAGALAMCSIHSVNRAKSSTS